MGTTNQTQTNTTEILRQQLADAAAGEAQADESRPQGEGAASVEAGQQVVPSGNGSHSTYAGEDEASPRDDDAAFDSLLADIEDVFDPEPYMGLTKRDLTDKFISDRFVEHGRSRVVRVTENGDELYVFDGQRWRRALLKKGLQRIAESWVQRCGQLCDEGTPTITVSEFGKVVEKEPSYVLKAYEMHNRLAGLISTIRSREELAIADDVFDKAKHLLVCANGTWDQEAQEFRASRAEDYQTRMVDVDYVEGYVDPFFEQSLMTFGGRGHEVERVMQLRLGEGLLARTTDRRWVMIEGPKDCGKSLFFNEWSNSFPEMCGMTPRVLLSGKEEANSTQFAKDRIKGMRMLLMDETGADNFLSVERWKELTTGGKISGRASGENWGEFLMTGSQFILFNYAFQLRGEVDDAALKRLLYVKAPVQFVADPDPDAEDQALADPLLEHNIERNRESYAKAALAWAIEGLKRLHDEYDDTFSHPKFAQNLPESIKAATEEYLGGADLIGQFMQECFQVGPWVASDPDEQRYETTDEQFFRMYKWWLARQSSSSQIHGKKRTQLIDTAAKHVALRSVGVAYVKGHDLRARARYNAAVDAASGGALHHPGPQTTTTTRRKAGQKGKFVGMRPAIAGFTGEPAGWPSSQMDADVRTPPEFSAFMDEFKVDDPRSDDSITFWPIVGSTAYVQQMQQAAAAFVAANGSPAPTRGGQLGTLVTPAP